SGTITIPAGQTSATIGVPVLSNSTGQGDHSFTLQINNAVNAGIARANGTGTIVDNDKLVISIGDLSQFEGNAAQSVFTFNVFLSAATTRDVTVHYATADDTAKAGADYTAASGTVTIAAVNVTYTTVDGTAKAGTDYVAASGTLTIPAGATSASVPIQALANPSSPRDRSFTLSLTGSNLSTIVRSQGTITLIDNAKVP